MIRERDRIRLPQVPWFKKWHRDRNDSPISGQQNKATHTHTHTHTPDSATQSLREVNFDVRKYICAMNMSLNAVLRRHVRIHDRGHRQTLHVGTRYCHDIFMCHKYHGKHTSKQCNLDRLKSGSKRDTNEMPTCAVPVHAPQTNALWWGGGGGYNQGSFVYFAKLLDYFLRSNKSNINQIGESSYEKNEGPLGKKIVRNQ